jgi:hypothetical protein
VRRDGNGGRIGCLHGYYHFLTAMLERRLRPATLHVFAENRPARAFYERFGFQQVDAWWDVQDRHPDRLFGAAELNSCVVSKSILDLPS